MSVWLHRVPSALAPHVTSCVGYDLTVDPSAVHFGLPSTSLTLIIAFDEPLDCGWLHQGGSSRYDLLVAGLHVAPSLVRTHGRQCGIQVALTPQGARTLLGLPAGALTHTLVTGEDVGLPGWLQPRLQEATWPERFALLDDVLLHRRHLTDPMGDGAAEARRLLTASRGAISVAALADRVGYSRRHLTALFTAEFGVSPKQYARLARFEHAQTLLTSGRALADVAHAAGFADQAHLTREWTALAGRSPSHAGEEFPILQDLGTP